MKKVFGRLTIIEVVEMRPTKRVLCSCSCGNTKIIAYKHLCSGGTKSCGCLRKEFRATHGKSYSKTYNSWKRMKDRCDNPNNNYYYLYGGKGITYCDRWNLFKNFLEDMGECPSGLSIERKDGNKNYEPNNCVWADHFTQNNNTNRNHYIEWNGTKQTIAMWSRERGLPYHCLANRLKRGWDIEMALTMPVSSRGR